jgi:hypothetical protein
MQICSYADGFRWWAEKTHRQVFTAACRNRAAYLHICILSEFMILFSFGWSENGPSADPPSGGSRRVAPPK